jgi:NTE family protein
VSGDGQLPSSLLSPVRQIPPDDGTEPDSGVGLCLSGGGYRAMLFHVGVLWRLNEAGWLRRLDRISSVSGGSITAGVLALAWNKLDEFEDSVVGPVRELAGHGIDVKAVFEGMLRRGSAGDHVAAAYRDHVFGDSTLFALPEHPRFVINATNVGSGALLRFERGQLADWRVGRVKDPDVDLAQAVACSSAFPPPLSPVKLDMRDADWVTEDGNELTGPEYRDELVLSDGGVYDNLGLETAWKRCRTVIVSDAGGQMAPEADPHADWPRHMLRILKVIDNQVRSLRKRQVIEGLKRGDRDGVYLGIRSEVEDYDLPDALPVDPSRTLELARLPTRLDDMPADKQERLINWGYAIGDTGLRRHLDPQAKRPAELPYPERGI